MVTCYILSCARFKTSIFKPISKYLKRDKICCIDLKLSINNITILGTYVSSIYLSVTEFVFRMNSKSFQSRLKSNANVAKCIFTVLAVTVIFDILLVVPQVPMWSPRGCRIICCFVKKIKKFVLTQFGWGKKR